jgi:hypothetical protein
MLRALLASRPHSDAAGSMGRSPILTVKYAVLKFQLQFPNRQCRGRFMTATLSCTRPALLWLRAEPA